MGLFGKDEPIPVRYEIHNHIPTAQEPRPLFPGGIFGAPAFRSPIEIVEVPSAPLDVSTFDAIVELLESAARWYDNHADTVRLVTGADMKLVEEYRAEAQAYRDRVVELSNAAGRTPILAAEDDPDAIELITKGEKLSV